MPLGVLAIGLLLALAVIGKAGAEQRRTLKAGKRYRFNATVRPSLGGAQVDAFFEAFTSKTFLGMPGVNFQLVSNTSGAAEDAIVFDATMPKDIEVDPPEKLFSLLGAELTVTGVRQL